MSYLWLGIAAAFAVLEALTTALFAAFIALGALAAAGSARLGLGALGQVATFLVVSLAGVLIARPPLLGLLKRNRAGFGSGAQSMVGQTASVVEEIRSGITPGHVRIAGESWLAVTDGSETLAVGETVRITALRQATLVVERATARPAE
ncbi:MAG: NfeD family protein [Candidatus Dormibacteria bacterium]